MTRGSGAAEVCRYRNNGWKELPALTIFQYQKFRVNILELHGKQLSLLSHATLVSKLKAEG
jgi:hypothetical protein